MHPSDRWREMIPLKKKIAVITDAVSPEFFFPRWYRYYGGLFGSQNLHVLTYAGLKPMFQDFPLGNIWEVNANYDDRLRAGLIADLISVLLNSYDVVLRCDVDEFLFPDPTKFLNLADFVEHNEQPYVTARGIDLIELQDDAVLQSDMPIIGMKKRFGIRSTALNKTCLTTIPMRWAAGFHAADVFPWFGGLYNFHLKFADLKGRIAWHECMLAGLKPGTSEYKYFMVGAEHLTNYLAFATKKPKGGAETEEEFDRRFLKSVAYNPAHKIYQGAFFGQDFLLSVEEKFNTPAANF